MKISVFQGVLLGVFGLAGLIGIFVFANYSGQTGGAQAIGTVTIWGTLPKVAMDQALRAAAQSNQDLRSVSYIEKDPSTFQSSLISAVATNSSPDLILISQEQLLPLLKVIQPISGSTLPASAFATRFAQEGELYVSPDNSSSYGIPWLIDPLVLYSNRTILSSSGIATPPNTWEALTGLVSHVATLTPTGNISRGLIALGTYNNVHNARGILSALFLQAHVPISLTATTGLHSANLGNRGDSGTPQGPAVVRFYTQFADSSKVSYTWNASLQDSQTAFLVGNLALYLGFASEAKYFKEANPNLDFGVSPLPQPATASAKSTYGLVYAFSIPKGAKNVSGGYLAASALSATAPDQIAASALGLAPADRVALSNVPTDLLSSVSYTSALYAKGWLSPLPADTDSVFSAMITNVISGRLTIASALSSAENTLTALLQQ